jgi:AcrR family transcriptional regulator
MPTSSRKKKRAAGRPSELDRERLLDVAELLFSEKGFEGTTTREVVKRARCNLALISYHFGGKDGLYTAVLLRYFERMRDKTLSERTDEQLASEWPELKSPEERRFCATLYELARGKTQAGPMQKVIFRELMAGGSRMTAVLKRSELSSYDLLLRRLESLGDSVPLREDLDLRLSVVCLFGPLVYTCLAAPILKDVYGFKDLGEGFVRQLVLHQTRLFFGGALA